MIGTAPVQKKGRVPGESGEGGEASTDGVNVRLPTSAINTTSHTQVRTGINEEVVSAYHDAMIEGAIFPPVVVFHDGTDYYLADGFHRVMAANRVGYTEIDATIHKGTQLDALWFAMGANKGHGLRMTKGDIKKAVEVALKAFPDKTQQAIADQVGCSQRYVGMVKDEFRSSSKLDSTTSTVTGKDGKTYPTSKPRKPKVPTTPEEEEAMYLDAVKPVSRKGYAPPCIGLQFARIAIMKLKEIDRRDTERDQALEQVRDWIDAADDADDADDLAADEAVRMGEYIIRVNARNVKSVQKKAIAAFGKDCVLSVEKKTEPKSRAEQLAVAGQLVEDAKSILEDLKMGVESWRDQLPDNLQDSEKASQLSECIESLEQITSTLEEADFDSVDFPGMYS